MVTGLSLAPVTELPPSCSLDAGYRPTSSRPRIRRSMTRARVAQGSRRQQWLALGRLIAGLGAVHPSWVMPLPPARGQSASRGLSAWRWDRSRCGSRRPADGDRVPGAGPRAAQRGGWPAWRGPWLGLAESLEGARPRLSQALAGRTVIAVAVIVIARQARRLRFSPGDQRPGRCIVLAGVGGAAPP